MKFGAFAGEAGQSRLDRFVQQGADGLKQFRIVERILHERTDSDPKGGEKLIGARR